MKSLDDIKCEIDRIIEEEAQGLIDDEHVQERHRAIAVDKILDLLDQRTKEVVGEIIGDTEKNVFQRDPSNEERDIRNRLRAEQRLRAHYWIMYTTVSKYDRAYCRWCGKEEMDVLDQKEGK